jgi:hypothetical protein
MSALDFFVLPLSVVVVTESELRLSQGRKRDSTTDAVLVISTVVIDVFFVLDLFFKVGQGVAVDLGLTESSVERLARVAQGHGSSYRHDDTAGEEVLRAYASTKSMWGPMAQNAALVRAPLEIAFMIPLWFGFVWEDGWRRAAMHSLRIHRVNYLFRYFSSRQEDLSADFRKVALFKCGPPLFMTQTVADCGQSGFIGHRLAPVFGFSLMCMQIHVCQVQVFTL